MYEIKIEDFDIKSNEKTIYVQHPGLPMGTMDVLAGGRTINLFIDKINRIKKIKKYNKLLKNKLKSNPIISEDLLKLIIELEEL